jgi:hypothetical protein
VNFFDDKELASDIGTQVVRGDRWDDGEAWVGHVQAGH